MALPPQQFPQDACESRQGPFALIPLVWFQEHFGPRGIWGFEVSSSYYTGLLLTSAQITLPPWLDFGDIDLNSQRKRQAEELTQGWASVWPDLVGRPRAVVLLSVEADQVTGGVPQPVALPKGKPHLATSWRCPNKQRFLQMLSTVAGTAQ